MLNLEPLLAALKMVSGERVMAIAESVSSNEPFKVLIPVTHVNPGDPKDLTLRKYARDWIKDQKTGSEDRTWGVEARFHPYNFKQSWYDDEGVETRLYGAIELTWWTKRRATDFEELESMQDAGRKRARQS
jgi:hypothetical protein